jgi:hypothetical protein
MLPTVLNSRVVRLADLKRHGRRSEPSHLLRSKDASGRTKKTELAYQHMKILVLNSGSSSQQACLYEIGETFPVYPPPPLWEGRIEWNGDTAAMVVKNSEGVVLKEELPVSSREQVIRHLLRTLHDGNARAIGSTLALLTTASLSALGYERKLSQPVIRLGMTIVTWPRELPQSFAKN